ncbi:DnaA N-terminal domain-containing protein [Paenibacillus terreus]|uniref:DnaA N-terminal domain-containing protein n=1 Tax=Paenibacillus terreus TaxID=1387834 RepID=A0ABV5BGY7_9BACL
MKDDQLNRIEEMLQTLITMVEEGSNILKRIDERMDRMLSVKSIETDSSIQDFTQKTQQDPPVPLNERAFILSETKEISGHHDAAEWWLQTLEIVKKTVEPVSFQTWFEKTSATFDGEMIVITCPTPFAQEWLYARYSNVILHAVELATGNPAIKIAFQSLESSST